MPITIGPGITVGAGITVGDNPPLVVQGLTMRLDAGDPVSYPGSGTTWFDISGNGANQTLINAPTYTSGTASYFSFSGNVGSPQYAQGTTSNVVPSTAYTKSVWFWLNSVYDNNLVSSDAGGHFLYFNGTSTLYAGHSNVLPYTGFGTVTTLSINTWYYAAVTFNTTEGIKLYVNGALNNSNASFLTAHTGNGSTNLACFAPAGNLLNGRIAEVYCYDRALTAAEVLQNFEASRARYGL